MKALLRASKRRLKRLRRPRNSAIILLYHSISDESCPWGLAVSPANFEAHLELLSRRSRVLSLDELTTALDRGQLPKNAVAITFDDGYVDNLNTARPLLEHYQLPATVFVPAGLVGSRRRFWWDELARLTLSSIELPHVVSLDIAGRKFSFDLGPEARLDGSQSAHGDWQFHEPAPTRRHLLLQTLWERLQRSSNAVRWRALCELREQAQTGMNDEPRRRVMNASETLGLVQGGLIEVGAHTMTHPLLSQLSRADQAHEITASKAELERIIDRPVSHFAYPHGGPGDYTQATMQLVEEANLRSACTTTEDWLQPGTNRYQLPRIYVPPLDGPRFERLLDYWL